MVTAILDNALKYESLYWHLHQNLHFNVMLHYINTKTLFNLTCASSYTSKKRGIFNKRQRKKLKESEEFLCVYCILDNTIYSLFTTAFYIFLYLLYPDQNLGVAGLSIASNLLLHRTKWMQILWTTLYKMNADILNYGTDFSTQQIWNLRHRKKKLPVTLHGFHMYSASSGQDMD